MIPFYLEDARVQPLALLKLPPPGTPLRIPVLVCPPWGWEEVASYRSRRHWAEALAAAGHPTLRFDLPGTGDSAGGPQDGDMLEQWVAATVAAARWLAAHDVGGDGVAALGLGFGGLVLRGAIAAGAPVAAAAFWADPPSGRAFTREQRAFSRLQDGRPVDAEGEPLSSPLPEGALEVGGFVLGAETLAELKGFDPPATAEAGLRRVLHLGRDGIAPDAGVDDAFRAIGVEVETAAGDGWAEMVGHPELTELPVAVVARVAAWLGDGERAGFDYEAGAAAESIVLDVDGVQVREMPRVVPLDFGRAYGVLAEPVGGAAGDLCAVFLNAGAIRHIGPNRLWVESARRWAARGVPSFRVDIEGIGEADGGDIGRGEIHSFYRPELDKQVLEVIEMLAAAKVGRHFIMVGLCAGGYWAYRAALDDSRVAFTVLLNAGALTWKPTTPEERQAQKLGRISDARWWLKLLRGDLTLSRVLYFARLAARRLIRRLRERGRGQHGAGGELSDLDADLERSSGRRVVLAFSSGEPLQRELEYKGVLARLERWPNVEVRELPGSDHTLRSAATQLAVRELLDGELARALDYEGLAQ